MIHFNYGSQPTSGGLRLDRSQLGRNDDDRFVGPRPLVAGALILRLPPDHDLLSEVLARIRALPAAS